jgi:hypothetical protein
MTTAAHLTKSFTLCESIKAHRPTAIRHAGLDPASTPMAHSGFGRFARTWTPDQVRGDGMGIWFGHKYGAVT